MVAPGGRAWSTLLRRARRLSVMEAARDRWLILAPHPDDETLGPGGLIAALADAGRPPVVAFLTDGSGSHVDAPGWSARRIATVRAGEARRALLALGVRDAAIDLGWPDAAPAGVGDPVFAHSVARLVARCRRDRIRHIAVTWAGEPHCDHEAAAALARAVAQRCGIALHDYLVWGWTDPALVDRLKGTRIRSIPTAAYRPRQRRAMAAHATQRGGRIVGGESFRLPRAMLRLIDRPFTLLLESRHAPRTLDRS